MKTFDDGHFTVAHRGPGRDRLYENGWTMYFEHNRLGDDCGGMICIQDGSVVDYDGVFELPRKVFNILQDEFNLDMDEL
jgi:hypothetical protein